MFAQHAEAVSNGGQIELRIGDLQLIDQAQQGIGLSPVERESECSGTLGKQLPFGVSPLVAQGAATPNKLIDSAGSPRRGAR